MSEPKHTGPDAPRGRRWDDRFTFLSLGRVGMNESVAVFGLISCLLLFSLALASDMAYGVPFFYVFPIGLAAWLFGRWVGAAMGASAVFSAPTGAVGMRRGLGRGAVGI